jgi:hypothetical protein
MQVSPKNARELVVDVIKAKLVPMLTSSPGLGKSSIVKDIANEFGLKLIDIRLSQVDPTELNGFASLSGDKATYKPMDIFPLVTDPIPKGYNGWLLFFDEMTSAAPATQAACYKIILDRLVGNTPLHKNVVMVAAGNKITDGAVVSRTSTALQSRMIHIELAVNKDDWVSWALDADIDHRVISFINFRPDLLQDFKPNHNDKTFSCPRTWQFLSDLIAPYTHTIPDSKLPLLQGTVGEGAGLEFFTFSEIYRDLVTIDEILAKPDTCRVPKEPSTSWALTGVIAHAMTEDNAEKLLLYVDRLPAEFGMLCIKQAAKKNPKLLDIPVMDQWLTKAGSILM